MTTEERSLLLYAFDLGLSIRVISLLTGRSRYLVSKIVHEAYRDIKDHTKQCIKNTSYCHRVPCKDRTPKLNGAGYYKSRTPSWWAGHKRRLSSCSTYVLSHILVACKHAGLAYLPKGMVVHHIDGVRTNNKVNNLIIMTRQEHVKLHALERSLTLG
jgi:hypothetical protein